MTEVNVTIDNGTGVGIRMEYRQGAAGNWMPLNSSTRGMKVSSQTQFRINGDVYNYAGGNWTPGKYYNSLPIEGSSLSFLDQDNLQSEIQYNQKRS